MINNHNGSKLAGRKGSLICVCVCVLYEKLEHSHGPGGIPWFSARLVVAPDVDDDGGILWSSHRREHADPVTIVFFIQSKQDQRRGSGRLDVVLCRCWLSATVGRLGGRWLGTRLLPLSAGHGPRHDLI